MSRTYYACLECKSCIYVGQMPSAGFWFHTDSEGMIAFARDWMPKHIGHTIQLLTEADIGGMEVVPTVTVSES